MTKYAKDSQKVTRAPEQRAAAERHKSAVARKARVASHNGWPVITRSEAETAFIRLLGSKPEFQVLTPYPFNEVENNDFHRHLGVLVDGLEMLPTRPDHAFDFFFRAVDELSQQMTKRSKITDAVEAIGPHVCGSLPTRETWKAFINLFSQRLPLPTAKFMAQRVLSAYGTPNDPVRPRAERLFGPARYEEIHNKFAGLDAIKSAQGSARRVNDAGIFLKHLVSLRAAKNTAPINNIYPALDLTKSRNIFDEPKSLWAMMSLAAFTSRNERFHGSSLSPFRSSKASLSTYASYYFEMLFVYTLAVGLMIELFEGCGEIDEWRANMDVNMAKLDELFGGLIK